MSDFKVQCNDYSVIINKNGITLKIQESPDGDISFITNNNTTLPIDFHFSDDIEWETYLIFENLMKSIIGRYVLYSKTDYNLPENFVNLDTRTITFMCDSYINNILYLKHSKEKIEVCLEKKKTNRDYDDIVRVRVCASGSKYMFYHQEFKRFYSELKLFIERLKQEEAFNKKLTLL